MIKAEIICDSITNEGHRLTTAVLQYPRIVHQELMTHRAFSRNSASSRAIPSKKFVDDVLKNPAMPVFWGANQRGMQAAEELDEEKKAKAKVLWLKARDQMVEINREMTELGLHKQIANRVLESWFHMAVIVSATEWLNFFALRCDNNAQPEIQALADAMLLQYVNSKPQLVEPQGWHLPFADKLLDPNLPLDTKVAVAVARIARVSYKNFDGTFNLEDDIKLHDKLLAAGHMSPFEHVAMAGGAHPSNFWGWTQWRKFQVGENRSVIPALLLSERVKQGSRFAQGATE